LRLIKKLQECATMGQADPILTRLGAGPAVKKLVETALALSSSQDPQQRNHAYSFMESAIKELEDDEKLHEEKLGMHGNEDGLNNHKLSEEEDNERKDKLHEEEDNERKDKLHEEKDDNNDHKLHEEEVTNHNQGARTTGSEQSTHNEEPYPGEGKDTTTGEKPMQDMDNTVNQWSETNGIMVPGIAPPMDMTNGAGAPPPGGGFGAAPGLDPNIAQEMGMQMPAPPPMDTNQMMRQMQYTVRHEMKNYDSKVVAPMMRHIKSQREALKEAKSAIRALSLELRETKTSNGDLKLDLDTIRNNASATFRETETSLVDPRLSPLQFAVQPVPQYERAKVAVARSEIEQMDKMLNSDKNTMYN